MGRPVRLTKGKSAGRVTSTLTKEQSKEHCQEIVVFLAGILPAVFSYQDVHTALKKRTPTEAIAQVNLLVHYGYAKIVPNKSRVPRFELIMEGDRL